MDNTEINAMLSELYERLRGEEKDLALLSKEVQILAKALETHAKEEMQKYSEIQKEIGGVKKDINTFKRMLWILIGVFAAQNEMVMVIVKKLITLGV